MKIPTFCLAIYRILYCLKRKLNFSVKKKNTVPVKELKKMCKNKKFFL